MSGLTSAATSSRFFTGLVAALLGIALTTQLHAQLIVTTNSDSGPGSLRQAIADAQAGDIPSPSPSAVFIRTNPVRARPPLSIRS